MPDSPAGVVVRLEQSGLAPLVASLSESGSPAADLLRQLPMQMLLLDRDLRIRWANDAFRHVCQEAHIAGRPASDFLTDLRAHSAHLMSMFAGELSSLSLQLQLRVPEGTSDAKVQVAALSDRTGSVHGLSLTFSEVHSQASGGETLFGTAQAMRQVFGSLPDLVLVLDPDLNLLFANRGMKGHSTDQLRGMHISEFLPPHLQKVALSAMRRTLDTGEISGYPGTVDDADGRTRHFEVRVSAIRRDQKIVGLTLNASETTEQVRAERAVATQARMIESMLEGVAVIDDHGVIVIANPAFDGLFDYGRGELLGRDVRTLVDGPSGQLERWQPVTANLRESVAVDFEGRKRGGGRFFATGVLSGFEIAGRNHRLLVLQDVSEHKQLERGILQAVNREQYRIGNDLHDGLGQELTGIALMLRGLAGRLTAEYPPLLPEIESITRLVSNAIESSRALARGLSPVNLERGGLQDALEALTMHASELYSVPVVFTHRLTGNGSLNAELANHLYRIAQEAVRNAVAHGQARSIRLHLSLVRAKVRLSITDDGIGMPPEAMDATGMGLKIMCYRARILGGGVTFEPVEPSGTRVICECPLETGGTANVRKLSRPRARS